MGKKVKQLGEEDTVVHMVDRYYHKKRTTTKEEKTPLKITKTMNQKGTDNNAKQNYCSNRANHSRCICPTILAACHYCKIVDIMQCFRLKKSTRYNMTRTTHIAVMAIPP